MSNDLNLALTKTNSLKFSVINAIMELEIAAAEARGEGDHQRAADLSLRAATLALDAVEIRKAEDAIRASAGLTAGISKLDTIAGDARVTLKSIRKGEDLLKDAAKLIEIVRGIASIVL